MSWKIIMLNGTFWWSLVISFSWFLVTFCQKWFQRFHDLWRFLVTFPDLSCEFMWKRNLHWYIFLKSLLNDNFCEYWCFDPFIIICKLIFSQWFLGPEQPYFRIVCSLQHYKNWSGLLPASYSCIGHREIFQSPTYIMINIYKKMFLNLRNGWLHFDGFHARSPKIMKLDHQNHENVSFKDSTYTVPAEQSYTVQLSWS